MSVRRAGTVTAKVANLLPVSGFRDPLSYTGLQAWYDLSDSTRMATSHLGTGAVTAGSTIGYVADKSGNGYHLTQGIANNRPTFAGAINGIPALTFDGSNDVLSGVAASGLSGDPSWTLFVVHSRSISTAGGGTVFSWGTRGGGSVNVVDDSVGRWLVGGLGATFLSSTVNTTTNTGFVISGAKLAGPNCWTGIWRNGTYIGAGSWSSTSVIVAAGGLQLGLCVSGPTYHNGLIGEVLLYSRFLSTAERRTLEAWLGAKWGVAVT